MRDTGRCQIFQNWAFSVMFRLSVLYIEAKVEIGQRVHFKGILGSVSFVNWMLGVEMY